MADHGPWVHVPDDLAEHLDKLSTTCRSLAEAWYRIGWRLGDPVSATAPLSRDQDDLAAWRPGETSGLGMRVGMGGAKYVDAMAQHIQSISSLLDARRIVLSIWPIVRAELEIAGRVAWFLEPGTPPALITAKQRLARYMMDLLASLCRERYTAERTRKRALARDFKRERDGVRTHLERLFPCTNTEWKKLDDEKKWNVGGESYLPVGRGANEFCRAHLGGARGLYDLLSGLSHPSLVALDKQSEDVNLGERILKTYVSDRETIEWPVQLACLALYKSAYHVAGYFELHDAGDELEQWADTCSQEFGHWFSSDPR